VFVVVVCGVVVVHGILVVAMIVELIARCVVQIVHFVNPKVGKGPARQPGAAADASAVQLVLDVAAAAADTSAVQLAIIAFSAL
jgi:hypothetical protein